MRMSQSNTDGVAPGYVGRQTPVQVRRFPSPLGRPARLAKLRKMRRTSVGLALVVALVPSWALAKDPPTKPLRASLEVEAGEAEDAKELEERVNTALGARLRKAEVLPRKSLEDGLIHVEVSPLPDGGGYHYDVYAEQADRTLADTKTEADCAGCDEAALLEAIGIAVDKCLPPLAATVAEPAAASKEPPPPAVVVTPAQPSQSDERRRAGPMGKAGIGLMVAGAATAVVGVIFVVQGRSFDTRPGALEQEGVDFRPPGFALLAGGAATLITGGVLYGVDRSRQKKASVAWVPGGAVASIGGRF